MEKTTREKSLEWFFKKTAQEKLDLREKYFCNIPMPYDKQWGFHFNFGQIESMYLQEVLNKNI